MRSLDPRPVPCYAVVHGLTLAKTPKRGLKDFIHCVVRPGPGVAAGKPRSPRDAFRIASITATTLEGLKNTDRLSYERARIRVEETTQLPKVKQGKGTFGLVVVTFPLKEVGLDGTMVRMKTEGIDNCDPSTDFMGCESDRMWMYSASELVRRGFPPMPGI